MTDGVVRSDAHGTAGAIGHVPYEPDGVLCACGARGCLEGYAGPQAVVSRSGLPRETALSDLAEQAAQGHEGSLQALDLAGTALGTVLSGALNIVDTSTIVLGGQLGHVTELLGPRLEAALRERAIAGESQGYQIVRSADDLAAASGAAISMLRPIVADPAAYLAAGLDDASESATAATG